MLSGVFLPALLRLLSLEGLSPPQLLPAQQGQTGAPAAPVLLVVVLVVMMMVLLLMCVVLIRRGPAVEQAGEQRGRGQRRHTLLPQGRHHMPPTYQTHRQAGRAEEGPPS